VPLNFSEWSLQPEIGYLSIFYKLLYGQKPYTSVYAVLEFRSSKGQLPRSEILTIETLRFPAEGLLLDSVLIEGEERLLAKMLNERLDGMLPESRRRIMEPFILLQELETGKIRTEQRSYIQTQQLEESLTTIIMLSAPKYHTPPLLQFDPESGPKKHTQIPAKAVGTPTPIPTPRAILSLKESPEGEAGTSSGTVVVKTEGWPLESVVVPTLAV
jgi:hypothetical protein